MRARRRNLAAAPGWSSLLLLLALSAGSAGADQHGGVSVSVAFGGYSGGPVMLGAGAFYYPAQYPYGVAAPGPYRPRHAFVDTDIHPEEAHVYLDGKLIGIADDFDGYPGYLAVKPGRHSLGFRYVGYHSVSFNLDLHAGEMIQLDRKMPKLLPGEKDEGLPPVPPSRRGQEASPPASEDGEEERRGGQGTLRLQVSPPEARVTLDGDFFGTGAEIARIRGGIPLSTGVHRIRVSLAGYRSESAETEIRESEERTLRISLEKQ